VLAICIKKVYKVFILAQYTMHNLPMW